jgi:hypothetical protein
MDAPLSIQPLHKKTVLTWVYFAGNNIDTAANLITIKKGNIDSKVFLNLPKLVLKIGILIEKHQMRLMKEITLVLSMTTSNFSES